MTADRDRRLEAMLVLRRLSNVGPRRLGWLAPDGDEVAALERLRAGVRPDILGARVSAELYSTWVNQARAADAGNDLERHRAEGITMLLPDDDTWPFSGDPEPPSMLFARGRVDLLVRRPAVAIVGTRRCTSIGRQVALEMGAALSQAGVTVVSGLALGIDGAAHRGALEALTAAVGDADAAPPVGVVGSGLDVVYPARHGELWEQIANHGLLVSEYPLGTRPSRWQFPARNRLLAGLVDLVVVVESHASGGALSTVDEAIDRDVEVVAVPGSVLSPASAGTNRLLVEGVQPVRSAADVLGLLSLSPWSASSPEEPDVPFEEGPAAVWSTIRAELAAGSRTIDQLAAVLASEHAMSLAETLASVQSLQLDGRVVVDQGRVVLPGAAP